MDGPSSGGAQAQLSPKSMVLRSTFDEFDTDRSGSLSREELTKLFDSLNWDSSGESVEDCFRFLDKNCDGGISFEEFLRWSEFTWSRRLGSGVADDVVDMGNVVSHSRRNSISSTGSLSRSLSNSSLSRSSPPHLHNSFNYSSANGAAASEQDVFGVPESPSRRPPSSPSSGPSPVRHVRRPSRGSPGSLKDSFARIRRQSGIISEEEALFLKTPEDSRRSSRAAGPGLPLPSPMSASQTPAEAETQTPGLVVTVTSLGCAASLESEEKALRSPSGSHLRVPCAEQQQLPRKSPRSEAWEKEFRALDVNNSGFLEASEIGRLLENLGWEHSGSAVEEVLRFLDKDANGKVDLAEWRRWAEYAWQEEVIKGRYHPHLVETGVVVDEQGKPVTLSPLKPRRFSGASLHEELARMRRDSEPLVEE